MMTTQVIDAALDELIACHGLWRTSLRPIDRADAAERLSQVYARLAKHFCEEHEQAVRAYKDEPAF